MKVKHIITTCGLLGGLIVTSGAGSAISNVAKSDVQFTFRPVLTLELDDNLSDTDYPNNTFLINDLAPGNVKDSNEVTATVTTNSAAGYTLSATVGDTTSAALNTTDLVLGSGGDKFEMTTDNVATLSTGKWGYRVKNGTYGNYSALDILTSKILNATRDNIGTASTASYPGGATTDMKIGAYAKTSQVAGKYQNVINFEAVANVSAHTVNLVAGTNAATATITAVDGTAITPATTGSYDEGTVLTIAATCNTGETFFGWSSNYDYGSITDKTLATTTYTVGGGSVNLTANCGAYTMQSITASMCTTTPTLVTDMRDNQEYVIQKLADGKCWMMTNLNLGATALATDLTSANTNLSNTVTAATFNSWKKSTGTGTYTAGEYIPVSGTDSTSQTPYGTLYNYCATSAGTICTSSNSSDAQYDICPKGWRLPTGGSSGEFQTLYSNASYNTYAKMRAPYTSGGAAFALAGLFSNAAPAAQGSRGLYWSSTRSDNTIMYRLDLDTSNVHPAYSASRDSGYSIRCVLK